MYTKPRVNAFETIESNVSPVPQAAAGPPLAVTELVAVCGVDVMVHLISSPTEIVEWAWARMPPVLVVQSTNPMSLGVAPPQGGDVFPILTS